MIGKPQHLSWNFVFIYRILNPMKLPRSYYLQSDVVAIGKDLIGKVICTYINSEYSSAIITETEAYAGIHDKAAHVYGDKRTKRTETMYQQGGHAYVYLCYGIHHLFNIVTNIEGIPNAVLLRGVQPLEGLGTMKSRRGKEKIDKAFSSGPGTATQALGIKTKHDHTDLLGDLIWLEDRGIKIKQKEIVVGPRIGVDYAGEDALLPYRFLYPKKIIL